MKVGVVADTHLPRFGLRLPAALRDGLRREGVGLIVHLGDFTGPESLRRLAAGGFGLNMNPAIKWTISDLLDQLLGEQRSARQWSRCRACPCAFGRASTSRAG